MQMNRRGLFKTLLGACVAPFAAKALPVPEPNVVALIEKRMADASAEMSRILSEGIRPDWDGTIGNRTYIQDPFTYGDVCRNWGVGVEIKEPLKYGMRYYSSKVVASERVG